MTTIIIDNKNKKLYTDSRASLDVKNETLVVSDEFIKVFYRDSNRLLCGTGSVKQIKNYINALVNGKKPTKLSKNTIVLECQSYSEYKVLVHSHKSIQPADYHEKFSVYGSGRKYAYGSLHNVPDPIVAMNTSIALDEYSGGNIIEYDISGKLYNDDIY